MPEAGSAASILVGKGGEMRLSIHTFRHMLLGLAVLVALSVVAGLAVSAALAVIVVLVGLIVGGFILPFEVIRYDEHQRR
jgi:hypothetical protein